MPARWTPALTARAMTTISGRPSSSSRPPSARSNTAFCTPCQSGSGGGTRQTAGTPPMLVVRATPPGRLACQIKTGGQPGELPPRRRDGRVRRRIEGDDDRVDRLVAGIGRQLRHAAPRTGIRGGGAVTVQADRAQGRVGGHLPEEREAGGSRPHHGDLQGESVLPRIALQPSERHAPADDDGGAASQAPGRPVSCQVADVERAAMEQHKDAGA